MDGYFSPRAKKLALQVSKWRWFINNEGVGLDGNAVHLVNIAMNDCKYNEIFVCRLKINHA